ncbi:hypothetical protein AMATHDRAFT_140125 [Amanita thiersii Skay4041]|uniref:Uncharacterized protein n=1 Tax=Amanita thiersii Skay4041 TaxID=703135 RepID=A0A2A9NND7_9AGAR|nr:hypothetical protein AMATHDRAFT_140125 [Amanita thiersii Skay4041]
MPASAFKAKARPLHVKLTDDVASDTASEGNTVGELTLNPSSFNTGSYGWKGSKRITVELDDAEGGEKTKVQVMLT